MKYLFLLTFIFLLACKNDKQSKAKPPIDEKEPVEASSESFSLIAVGDMMLGTDFPNKTRFPSSNILAVLSDTLKDADFTIGNLEGVLADASTRSRKCEELKNNCYAFRSPLHFADYFKDAGFDYLSIANNHSGDFGDAGIQQTMKALDQAGIKYSGLKNICEVAILENNGFKLGLIGVGHGGRHVHINDQHCISELIGSLKQKTDVVVVFFHGGAEGSAAERVPKKAEIHFGENRGNVYELARKSVDAGADLIIGSGPHLTRAMEVYKGKFIAYSLGNFATYGMMSVKDAMGWAPILKLNISKSGDFISGRIIPTKQIRYNTSTPMIDKDGSVIKRLIKLNALDFPDNDLNVAPDGTLTIKNF